MFLLGHARFLSSVFLLGVAVVLSVCSICSGYPSANVVERNWLQEDGLPSNIVSRVLQDEKGYLWLTTSAGIARFDGRNFQTVPVPRANPSTRDAALAQDGSLVCLPRAGGVYSVKDGVIAEHAVSPLLRSETLLKVHVSNDGAVWLGGNDLYRWHDGRLTHLGSEHGFSREYGTRYSFATDQTGATWIAVGSRVFFHQNNKLALYSSGTGAGAIVAPDRAGGIWMFLGDRLVSIQNGTTKEPYKNVDWHSLGEIVSFLEDRRGILWMATRAHGVFCLSRGALLAVPVSHQKISTISEDAEGNLWLASDGGGLIRLNPKAFILLNSSSGLQVDVSNSVAADPSGALWIANNEGGLVRWFEGTATQVFKGEREKDRCFLVCADANRRVWFSMSDGLYRVPIDSPGLVERVGEITGPVDALYCARNGDMWISARDKRVGYFRNDVYHPLSSAIGAPAERLIAFAEDTLENFWIASHMGNLHRFESGRFLAVTVPEYVSRIHDIHLDRTGALWLSTTNGLVRRNESGRYDIVSSRDGMPEETILQILEDDSDRLWLGSTSGIFNITLSSLYEKLDRGGTRLEVKTFGRNEGIVGASAFFSGPPTACRSSDGTLWFVTHRGVVGMLPDVVTHRTHSVPVYIDSVFVDGRPQTIGGSGRLRVRTQESKVDFHLVALSYAAPEKLKIFHRLKGLDKDWVQTGADGKASYGHLPPGYYTMEVMAGTDEHWNAKGTSLAIYVAAAWWQTWWFRAGCLVVAVGAIFLIVNFWSHRRLRSRLDRLERAHALELERARIARDLHDDLGGSLTHIRLMTERLKKESEGSPWAPPLTTLADCVRRIMTTLEGIIWTVNPKNSSWPPLVDFLAAYLRKATEGAGVSCVIERPDSVENAGIMPEVQHHVIAITKEAISNLLKHSGAKNARMTITIKNKLFVLELSDDGAGFDVAAADQSERNGLRNIRSRAREIGAEIDIWSQPGGGTKLALRVHLKAKARPLSSPGAVSGDRETTA